MGQNKNVPSPNQYSSHRRMTDARSRSAERNAPRCTIGNGARNNDIRDPTPGPTNYHTESRATIGDAASVTVPIPRAIRPISARPGEIKKIVQPGPQDYQVVRTELYRRR